MSFFGQFRMSHRSGKTLVGRDEFGNCYYKATVNGVEKRWVVYNGMSEPTKVPAEWHIWLHYTDEKVPDIKIRTRKHVPNLTGTAQAYNPHFSISEKKPLNKHKSYYESWSINQSDDHAKN